jgi:hypothetical protein
MNTVDHFRSRLLRASVGAVLLSLFASGCTTGRTFTVDAVARSTGSLQPHAYTLVDARPDSAADDASSFAAVARDVHTALSSKGMYAAPAKTSAAVVVEVDYGISAPIARVRMRTEPILVMATRASSLSLQRDGSGMVAAPVLQEVGTREVPYSVTTYEKFVRLTAREAQPEAGMPARQLWSVVVSNDDETSDLARCLHLMIAAAMDSIGTDNGKERQLVLTERDGRVRFLEKGLETS